MRTNWQTILHFEYCSPLIQICACYHKCFSPHRSIPDSGVLQRRDQKRVGFSCRRGCFKQQKGGDSSNGRTSSGKVLVVSISVGQAFDTPDQLSVTGGSSLTSTGGQAQIHAGSSKCGQGGLIEVGGGSSRLQEGGNAWFRSGSSETSKGGSSMLTSGSGPMSGVSLSIQSGSSLSKGRDFWGPRCNEGGGYRQPQRPRFSYHAPVRIGIEHCWRGRWQHLRVRGRLCRRYVSQMIPHPLLSIFGPVPHAILSLLLSLCLKPYIPLSRTIRRNCHRRLSRQGRIRVPLRRTSDQGLFRGRLRRHLWRRLRLDRWQRLGPLWPWRGGERRR